MPWETLRKVFRTRTSQFKKYKDVLEVPDDELDEEVFTPTRSLIYTIIQIELDLYDSTNLTV